MWLCADFEEQNTSGVARMAGVVVVFDFDKTILECDSDNWVVDQLGLTDLFNQLLFTLPWNTLMDRMMMELHYQGRTIEEIAECLRGAPLHPNIVSSIKTAHASGCDLRIVSDSNVFFIKTILKHHGLINCFSEIHTNPSVIDEKGRLNVLPYHDFHQSSHGCNICPPNMCKGLVMEKLRTCVMAEGKKHFIYVGDGNADFCAGLKLEENDVLMPRKNFPIWDLICRNLTLLKANVDEWNDGTDFATILLSCIDRINRKEDGFVAPVQFFPVACKFQTGAAADAVSEIPIRKCEPC